MFTLSLMQPYFFPYMGYFDLLAFSDIFVFYDDAAFSKNSWYNRNRIAGTKERWDYIGVAVRKSEPLGTPSTDILLARKESDLQKLLRQLDRYSKAPHYETIVDLVRGVFEASDDRLASVAMASVRACAKYLGLGPQILRSSEINYDRAGNALTKVLGICAACNAGTYLNLSGGRSLYKPDDFRAAGMALSFCRPEPIEYQMLGCQFEPYLSVLDALMWISPEQARPKLRQRTPIHATNSSVDFPGR